MNIYLVVEIKHREFLSRLLIGATSAINGNDVLIETGGALSIKILLKFQGIPLDIPTNGRINLLYLTKVYFKQV